MTDKVNKGGRPPKPMPEPIDAPPETIAAALMAVPPKREKDWRYLKDAPPKGD